MVAFVRTMLALGIKHDQLILFALTHSLFRRRVYTHFAKCHFSYRL